MYQRILVPTDGSEGAKIAADHGIEMALQFDAALHTIYVIESDIGPDSDMVGVFEAFEEAGQQAIDDVVGMAQAAGVGTVEGTVAQGTPSQAILDYVEQFDIDMIVMGTQGRTGIDRILLGSVTEKVVRMAPVPVLTVSRPPEEHEERP